MLFHFLEHFGQVAASIFGKPGQVAPVVVQRVFERAGAGVGSPPGQSVEFGIHFRCDVRMIRCQPREHDDAGHRGPIDGAAEQVDQQASPG